MEAIDQALSALRAIGAPTASRAVSNNSVAKVTRKRRHLSAAGRRNIVAALKKRWAAKRAAEGNSGSTAAAKHKSKRK
jgi:hypothetical protein